MITELPVAVEAIAEMFRQAVNEVEGYDHQLGDTTAKASAFIADLKEQHPEAVKQAEEILAQVKSMEDAPAQAVIAYLITRDRDVSGIATAYIKANEPAPDPEAEKLSNDKLAEIWAARSMAQKKAAAYFGAIKVTLGVDNDEDLASVLPAVPKGLRGAAPGTKRGKMGRKLPAGIHWTVGGEEIGEKDTKTVASVVGVSVSELRNALEKAFPETLPNVFEAEVNGKQVRGVIGEPTTPVADEDDEDDDLGELDFED